MREHAASVLLAISQAPVAHPESGAPMTLEMHRSKLLDPSGLDEAARALFGALPRGSSHRGVATQPDRRGWTLAGTLGANVLCYHLLDRGDASWLVRDGIIERIRALEPIGNPAALFQSAIDEGDKESLRELIRVLGETVGSLLCDGAYEAAVDAVSASHEAMHMIPRPASEPAPTCTCTCVPAPAPVTGGRPP